MSRAIATLLLLAHVGVLAAPVLAEAGPSVRSDELHCAAPASHAEAGVAQPSEDCDGCDMPACPGMASCASVGAAIIAMASFDFSPTTALLADQETPGGLANLQFTPLPPPPKP